MILQVLWTVEPPLIQISLDTLFADVFVIAYHII
jgi:hypothetical protein